MKKIIFKLFSFVFILFIIVTCSKDDPIIEYTLTTTISPSNGGTVSPSSGSFKEGEVITLKSNPSQHYKFKNWGGDVSGTENSITVTMNSNKKITVNFEKKEYPLSITVEGEGTVKEELLQSKPSGDYPSGSVVKLTAVPADGWEFESWSGDYVGSENPININVDKEKTLTLKFIRKQEFFVSKSPTYSYPNNTVGKIVTSKYFPGVYINREFADQHINNINVNNPNELEYSFFGSQGVFFDYNNDGFLDFFGFLTNMVPAVSVNNGQFVLINNIYGETPIKKYFDTDIKILSMELNQLDGDSQLEIILFMNNSHHNGLGGYAEDLPVRIIDIDTDGTLTHRDIDIEPMGIHAATSGDVDNDGDTDILIWRGGGQDWNRYPILYFNDGNGNFTLSDNFVQFDGLQYILENYREYWNVSIVLFDLNNDGFLDLITCLELFENENPLSWLLGYRPQNSMIYWGDGTGKFDLLNNYTELPNSSITDFSKNNLILGFNFFDYDNDGDYDVVCAGTPNYGGYFIQLYEQTSEGVFEDVTTSVFDKWIDYTSGPLDPWGYQSGVDGDFPNFYTPRIYDKNGDGLYDIVPDNLAIWNGFKFVSNLYWENIGGSFTRREEGVLTF